MFGRMVERWDSKKLREIEGIRGGTRGEEKKRLVLFFFFFFSLRADFYLFLLYDVAVETGMAVQMTSMR